MSDDLRPRDPGLQPERTALSWHRTAFTVLVFSLAAVRVAVSRSDVVSLVLSSIGTMLALVLVGLSWHRQKTMLTNSELMTPTSILAKRLISFVLCILSLSLALPALLNLISNGDV